ncbi:MAG: RluA family pseudouridine synthase [Gemmatimonadota bacterium]|nr:MAG: RluA family pseudouridine synthase [Gemmatimonadota bacterium]
MEQPITFQVLAPSTERLDRFLAHELSLSRTQAARLVAEGAVRVNHERARASRCLSRGDLLRVELRDPGGKVPRRITARDHPLDVVYEDDHLLVLNKPAGLVVHPAPGHWEDTLLNALAARGTQLAARGEARPGIVHRLDKDTSGLMVLAKTDVAHRKLARDLAKRRVERVYACLSWGHLKGQIEIAAAIARHPKDRKRMAVLATGRMARTRVAPVARFDLCDLARVGLATGRTHQIRVHLSHVGHPVVGDPVYGSGGHRRVTASQRQQALALTRATPRQALHATELGFSHPVTGEGMRFRADWPRDLRRALATASDDPDLLDRTNVLEYLGFAQ